MNRLLIYFHVILRAYFKNLSPPGDNIKLNFKVLNHPNIVLYIDSALESQALLIVMEYVNGGNLHDFLMNQTELLAEDKVLNYFTQLIVALNHIHSKNVLHRDLKANLILKPRLIRRIIQIRIKHLFQSKILV